jgi:hypothetical protein
MTSSAPRAQQVVQDIADVAVFLEILLTKSSFLQRTLQIQSLK